MYNHIFCPGVFSKLFNWPQEHSLGGFFSRAVAFANYFLQAFEDWKIPPKPDVRSGQSLADNSCPPIFYSTLISKIYRCDLFSLSVSNQAISYDDIKFLTFSKIVCDLYFDDAVVLRENDEIVSLEEILQHVPKLTLLSYKLPEDVSSTIITSESVKKVIKSLNPLRLKTFALNNIPSSFNFDIFSTFMRANPNVEYRLSFTNPLPTKYVQKLQTFVDEIIVAEESVNPPPYIEFSEMTENDRIALNYLRELYYSTYNVYDVA